MSVPALRFKDEHERDFPEWIVKILSNLVSTPITYGVVKPDKEDANGVKLIRGGDVSQGKINPNLRTIRKDISEQYKRTILQGGELVVSLVGNPGEIAIVPEELKGSNLARQVGLVRLSNDANSRFILYCLTFSTALITAKITGSVQKVINLEDLQKLEIKVPSFAEQTKIANFLTAVDEKITQLTQKCELLAQYKKGVMQQIFSQELRFKGDDGQDFPDWAEQSLSNLGSSFNGLTGKSGDDFGAGLPYITYKQIFDSSIIDTSKFSLVKISDNERQNKVKYGDVFFTTSSETPEEVGFCSVLLTHVTDVFLNSFCFGYRIKSFEVLEPHFARYIFKSPNFRRDVIKLAQGSTRYNISKTSFMETIVLLPCIKEQTKIANFLTAIDDKLTHTQAQLTAAKQYRQGLLQQMFV